MTRQEAVDRIRSGRPVCVAFLKRTDGSLRIMVAKAMLPSVLTDRITVEDLRLHDVRCVLVEGIVAVSTRDRWEVVV